MKHILKLKHWKIFIVWILGTIQMKLFIETELWFISFYIYYGLFILWIYSIGEFFNKDNPKLLNKIKLLSITTLLLQIGNGLKLKHFFEHSELSNSPLLSLFGFLSGITFIILTLVVSKSMQHEKNNSNLKFSEYAKDFFLLLIFTLGVWFIQPKMNKLLTEKTTGNNG